jgi:tetratricopeptide (TPR) repeat protein
MFELVREYVLERLHAVGEEMDVRRRHAEYVLDLVEALAPKTSGPESRIALEQLEAELPNIRGVFAWARTAGEHDLALQLAAAPLPLWLNLAHRSEGRAILQAALSRPDAWPPIVRAQALNRLGRLNWRDANRWPETRAVFEESLAIFRDLGDLDGSSEVLSDMAFMVLLSGDVEHSVLLEEESLRDARAAQNNRRAAWALQGLASKAFYQGDDVQGQVLLEESQALFEQLKDQFGYDAGLLTHALALQGQGNGARALALLRESSKRYYGWALLREGDYGQATDVLQQSLTEYRKMRAFERIPQVLNMLGESALARGDYLAAQAYFQESRALCSELSNAWDDAGALLGEGHVARDMGDGGLARASYAEALQRFARLPDWDERRCSTGVAFCLDGLASVVVSTAPERATRLWSGAQALRATVGLAALRQFDISYPLPRNLPADDAGLTTVRAQLSKEAFAAAWAEGQALTLEQAIAEALNH